MKFFKTLIGVLIVLGVGGFAGMIATQTFQQLNENVGSVAQTGEYHYVATSSAGTTQIVENQRAVLGSVVISTDSAGTFVVKDATSTTDSLAVTVASFEATQAEGTYTFDINLQRGLQIVGGASADGLITVTYR